MSKTQIECGECDNLFSPHKHEKAKGAAVGAAAIVGAKIGGGFGIVSGWLPGGATGAGVGAALAGGATALGAKSVTVCPNCENVQIF
jgi:hypothetical protein